MQSSALMGGLESRTPSQREGTVLCQHQLRGRLQLFVCSFHLYPSVQPSPTSHSPVGDSGSVWIHSSSCCFWNSNLEMSIICSPEVTDIKNWDMLTKCVLRKQADMRLTYTQCRVYTSGSSYLYTKWWELLRRCSCCSYCMSCTMCANTVLGNDF